MSGTSFKTDTKVLLTLIPKYPKISLSEISAVRDFLDVST